MKELLDLIANKGIKYSVTIESCNVKGGRLSSMLLTANPLALESTTIYMVNNVVGSPIVFNSMLVQKIIFDGVSNVEIILK